jgi:polyhydroxybutyrate depolymerase
MVEARWRMGGIVVAVVLAACGVTTTPDTATTAVAADTTTPPDAITQTVEVDGLERRYLLHVPERVDDPAPLVIDLHGFGSTPEVHEMEARLMPLADREGFVLAQPYARGGVPAWNPQPGARGAAADVAFLRALVGAVAAAHPIDPDRVHVMGHSNGGGMAHRMACDAADLIASIGSVSGQYPITDTCNPTHPVSVLAMHGTDDRVVPYGGVSDFLPDVPGWAMAWADRLGCERPDTAIDGAVTTATAAMCDGGVEVVLVTIDGGDHAWPARPGAPVDASEEIWRFLESHPRR